MKIWKLDVSFIRFQAHKFATKDVQCSWKSLGKARITEPVVRLKNY